MEEHANLAHGAESRWLLWIGVGERAQSIDD